MNVKASSRVFRLLVFFGCGSIIRLLDCLEVNAVYGKSDVVFTCVSPFTVIQQWKINSSIVAACLDFGCNEEPSNPARYVFTPNRTSGIFIFNITSINSTDDKTIVGCSNGSHTETLVITIPDQISSISNTTSVTVVYKPVVSDGNNCGTWCIVGIILAVIFVLSIVIGCCCVKPRFTKIILEATEIQLEWTDRLNCCQKIFEYNISCNKKGEQMMNPISTKERHCTLKNLDSMAIYEISLCRTLCCCKRSITKISVITRKSGKPIDQIYHAKSTSIDLGWTKPNCFPDQAQQLLYTVTCNDEVMIKETNDTKYSIEELTPDKSYKIEVCAVHNETNSLLFAEEILTKPIKVSLADVHYTSERDCVKCNVKWTVEEPETFKELDTFLVNITEEQKLIGEEIKTSRFTILDLYPDRSYTVEVYAIFHLIMLAPPCKIEFTQYTPKNLTHTETSTEIELKWEKPISAGTRHLEYEVICNKVKRETRNTSCKIGKLDHCQRYDISIFSIINGIKSLPLQGQIKTQPLQSNALPPLLNGKEEDLRSFQNAHKKPLPKIPTSTTTI